MTGSDFPRTRISRAALLVSGIILCQFILFGPSLLGKKILLPLDILAAPTDYLPPSAQAVTPKNPVLSDIVCQFEPERRFAIEELRAGRLPMWAPYQFAGAPVVWPKFSVFQWLGFLTPSPVILAWVQLFAALVAGAGAYLFFRRALGVGFWAAAFPAWCYPLTGFFIFWLGYPTCHAVYWFPWLLLAVNETVRGKSPLAVAGLGVVTALVLTSGHIDVAGQVLLASGLFGAWSLWDSFRGKVFHRAARNAALKLALGWCAGFLIAAPHILPLVEYARTGTRMIRRGAGREERPPVGLAALPQIVLPYVHGSTETDSLPFFPENEPNLLESPATGYAGIVAALLVAPLAWCSRRHRAMNFFWLALGVAGLAWTLNVPGFVQFFRLPLLNMMSHNRLVFWTAFAILALAAIGLDAVRERRAEWRRWFWLLVAALAGLAAWTGERGRSLPAQIEARADRLIELEKSVGWIRDRENLRAVEAWFARTSFTAAALCGFGVAALLLMRRKKFPAGVCAGAMGLVMFADMILFARGHVPQCDPALYYPRLPLLEAVAKLPPARVVGYGCLPATLTQTHGLRDVRGYDSIDPARYIELLMLAADPAHPTLTFAKSQRFIPLVQLNGDSLRLPPALDLLGARYVIFRGEPPTNTAPALRFPDYWMLENPAAMPRAFIPRSVETVADDAERLGRMKSFQFNPRETAFVETPVNLPAECRGAAEITGEIPTRIVVAAKMETPGLLVLADLWDKGWRATVNGTPAQILRADHALRGVVLPAGDSVVEFSYAPASFRLGLWLAAIGFLVIAACAVLGGRSAASKSMV